MPDEHAGSIRTALRLLAHGRALDWRRSRNTGRLAGMDAAVTYLLALTLGMVALYNRVGSEGLT